MEHTPHKGVQKRFALSCRYFKRKYPWLLPPKRRHIFFSKNPFECFTRLDDWGAEGTLPAGVGIWSWNPMLLVVGCLPQLGDTDKSADNVRFWGFNLACPVGIGSSNVISCGISCGWILQSFGSVRCFSWPPVGHQLGVHTGPCWLRYKFSTSKKKKFPADSPQVPFLSQANKECHSLFRGTDEFSQFLGNLNTRTVYLSWMFF